jgi:undecaprenyl diphosphate synthase
MNRLNHVAIIMDGNGRWGLKYKKSRNLGHKEGLKVIEKVISYSIKHKIKFLTLFSFSTENWKRPKKEVNYIFNLLENFLKEKSIILNNQKIKLKVIGTKNFSLRLNSLLIDIERKTKKNRTLQINLALNYGSKIEIINALKKMNKKKVNINIKNFEKNLETKNIPDPDLLIRTGNTKRLSNFLLWQLAYSEIFFIKKLWPEFNENDFNRIIKNYKRIKRNFGAI